MARSAKRIVVPGAIFLAALSATLSGPPAEAHKGITSKYNYNEHVFPILRDRCGSCHFAGGPAPLSLVEYLEAVPWAESIREQLVAQKMPPWYVDPTGPAVKGGHPLPNRELDMLLDWAAGGTPRADEKTFVFGAVQGVKSPTYEGPPMQWKDGTPDVILTMTESYTLPPAKTEDEHTFTLPTGLKEAAWVKAVDMLPGVRSMVRDAVISVAGGPMLAAWVPGHKAIAAPSGTAFRLPTNATLTHRMHYKKNWHDEQTALSDRSSIGLYFTEAPVSGKSIETLAIDSPNGEQDPSAPYHFSGAVPKGARVLAFTPSFDKVYRSVVVEATMPTGNHVTLLKLRAVQPQWFRRYWLQEPVELPAGSNLKVTATPAPADEFGVPIPKPTRCKSESISSRRKRFRSRTPLLPASPSKHSRHIIERDHALHSPRVFPARNGQQPAGVHQPF